MYKGRKYAHSEEVVTSQACLNCTCQRGFVSCFLRVCPVLDPPENDDTCYLLKEPGTCCAVLKCSGLISSSSPSLLSTSRTTTTTTKAPSTSAYHFNPIKNSNLFNGNSLERKAPESFRRATARPPYKEYWTSIRPTSRQQPQSRPLLSRATSRPTSYASITRVTTTQRPVNRNGHPAAPTFSQRRPNYPVFATSKPTLKRTLYTTTTTSRKPLVTQASSASTHQLLTPLQSPLHNKDNEEITDAESGNFFRMSSILV